MFIASTILFFIGVFGIGLAIYVRERLPDKLSMVIVIISIILILLGSKMAKLLLMSYFINTDTLALCF